MNSKQIFQQLVEKLGNVSLEILYGSIVVLVSNVLKKIQGVEMQKVKQ